MINKPIRPAVGFMAAFCLVYPLLLSCSDAVSTPMESGKATESLEQKTIQPDLVVALDGTGNYNYERVIAGNIPIL